MAAVLSDVLFPILLLASPDDTALASTLVLVLVVGSLLPQPVGLLLQLWPAIRSADDMVALVLLVLALLGSITTASAASAASTATTENRRADVESDTAADEFANEGADGCTNGCTDGCTNGCTD